MKPGDPAALTGRLFRDMAGALELLTVYLGERLGLYQALYAGGPATSAELAARTGTIERFIREWLEQPPHQRSVETNNWQDNEKLGLDWSRVCSAFARPGSRSRNPPSGPARSRRSSSRSRLGTRL